MPPLVQFGIRKVAASRRPSNNIVAIFSTSLVIYAQSYCLQWPTFIKVEHDIISSKRKVCRRGNIRNDEDRSARHKFIKKEHTTLYDESKKGERRCFYKRLFYSFSLSTTISFDYICVYGYSSSNDISLLLTFSESFWFLPSLYVLLNSLLLQHFLLPNTLSGSLSNLLIQLGISR